MATKTISHPPLRTQGPRIEELGVYPYALWMDAVLAEFFPGMCWAKQDDIMTAPLGPGMVLCLYAVSQTDIRIELAADTSSEPLARMSFSPATFRYRDFLSWVHRVADHVQEQIALLDKIFLGGTSQTPLLAVRWPASNTGCLDFPLSISRRGENRVSSRIFEDPQTLSRDQDLFPLCGLCVFTGYDARANTHTAALLAAADRAANKSAPIYLFRQSAASQVILASGPQRDLVADRSIFAPDDQNGADAIGSHLRDNAQTVLVDLGAQALLGGRSGQWAQQLSRMSERATNYMLFLEADPTRTAAAHVEEIMALGQQVARIFWVESPGRICPVYSRELASGRSLPPGVIFSPFA